MANAAEGRSERKSWEMLGSLAPGDLVEARLQLHYAAQIVSSVGFTFVAPKPDWSHTNLGWSHDLGALVSRQVAVEKPYHAALRFSPFRLLLLDDSRRELSGYSLPGHTVDDGYAWLASAIEDYTGQPPAKPLFRPQHPLPAYPAGEGEPFPGPAVEEAAELARWYANAERILSRVRTEQVNASEVRCWSHHFDIATLIELDAGREVESARTIGAGISPGDESYPQPYFYVSPWPYPKDVEWPPIEGEGSWHTDGFTATVLPGSRLLTGDSQEAQAKQASAYLESSIAACRKLLAGG